MESYMISMQWRVRAALAVLSCALVAGCDDGSDAPRTATPPSTAPAASSTPPASSGGPASAAVTADLAAVATRLGTAYTARAKFTEAMAKGTTLSAADTQAYWKACADTASISDEIDQITRKNPRWKRQMTEAMTSHAKSAIIRNTKASRALDAARKSGSAGKPAGPPPADLAAIIQKHGMVEMRVKGMMPYTKQEME